MSTTDIDNRNSGRIALTHSGKEAILSFQRWVLGLFVFTGFLAIIEPAPYEFLFLLALLCFTILGLRLHAILLIPSALLLTFIIGGIIGLLPYIDEFGRSKYIAVSFYLALTSVFFACVTLEDCSARLRTIKTSYILSATIASTAGIIGYANIGGLSEIFTLHGRASGTFKDPNVLSTYIVPALVFVADDILVRRKPLVWRLICATIIALALLLAFSRGAWVNGLLSLFILVLFSLITTPSLRRQSRILTWTAIGAVALIILLFISLSFASVREIFEVRASITQSYDVGDTGRFGTQVRGISLILDNWQGLGPHIFSETLGQDPHNTYINAFAVYGWLGGISFFTLIVISWIAGLWRALTPSPVQQLIIAVYAPFLAVTLQAIQIDIDHWRHFFMLLGLLWGLITVSLITPRVMR